MGVLIIRESYYLGPIFRPLICRNSLLGFMGLSEGIQDNRVSCGGLRQHIQNELVFQVFVNSQLTQTHTPLIPWLLIRQLTCPARSACKCGNSEFKVRKDITAPQKPILVLNIRIFIDGSVAPGVMKSLILFRMNHLRPQQWTMTSRFEYFISTPSYLTGLSSELGGYWTVVKSVRNRRITLQRLTRGSMEKEYSKTKQRIRFGSLALLSISTLSISSFMQLIRDF